MALVVICLMHFGIFERDFLKFLELGKMLQFGEMHGLGQSCLIMGYLGWFVGVWTCTVF